MKNAGEIIAVELDRSLRLVYDHRVKARAEILGVAVRAGSANDGSGREGLAHFVEHTIFKGTERRSSWHIINRMEAVGGELNAFTTKEETVVYTVFPSGEAARGAELLADLIVNSRFPGKELDKEREVVRDEIDSYLDTPSEAIFDDFEDLIFANSPVGHNILGTQQTLSAFTPEMCREFLKDNYRTGNMVVFYSGGKTLEAVRKMINKYFSIIPESPISALPCDEQGFAAVNRFDVRRDLANHQTHIILGTRVPGIYSDQRYAVALLANILGGPGMNSLLNIELRERRGLVYTVEATTAAFTGGSALTVYFGCDADDSDRCRRLCVDVFKDLASHELKPRRLEAAKKQYLGQLVIAGENSENRILGTARSVLFRGHVASSAETEERIRAITSEDLRTLATRLATDYSCLIFY